MASSRTLDYYKHLYETLEILPRCLDQVKRETWRLLSGKALYEEVEAHTDVPWFFTGAIHELECDCNFNRQILNGEKFARKTTIVPIGLGPWHSWVESAVYALDQKREKDPTWQSLVGWSDWTIQRCCMEWERWNGGGYARRNRNSPYLWSGSNHGVGTGYYTSDGKYSETAESKQIGAAVLLWQLKHSGG